MDGSEPHSNVIFVELRNNTCSIFENKEPQKCAISPMCSNLSTTWLSKEVGEENCEQDSIKALSLYLVQRLDVWLLMVNYDGRFGRKENKRIFPKQGSSSPPRLGGRNPLTQCSLAINRGLAWFTTFSFACVTGMIGRLRT